MGGMRFGRTHLVVRAQTEPPPEPGRPLQKSRAGSRGRLVGAVVAGLVCLIALLVGGVGVSQSDGARGAVSGTASRLGGPAALVPSRDRAAFTRGRRLAMARAVRRRRWLESSGGRAQRVASQTAFRGLAGAAAQRLLVGDYGSLLAGAGANPAASIVRMGRVVRYVGSDRALVLTSHGLRMVTSTAPLRVADGAAGEQPVDLDLAARAGRFAPVRPLVGVSVGKDSSGGVELGGSGVRVFQEGANVPGRMVGRQSVFFPDVGVDADATVTPTLRGVELAAVLRSQASPERIAYRVRLPAGDAMHSVGGGAVVTRGARSVVSIAAPSARDAQGALVPVEMSVDGARLVLRIPRHPGDVAYPVLVDPQFTVISESEEGWEFSQGHEGCTYAESESGLAPTMIGTGPPSLGLSVEGGYRYSRSSCKTSVGGWTWTPSLTAPVSAEFEDISLSGSTSYPTFAVCDNFAEFGWGYSEREIYLPNPPPSNLVLEATECTRAHSTVRIDLQVGLLPYMFGTTEGSGSVSVGAVVLSEPAGSSSVESELFGTENPAERDRTTCLKGGPVNCATGNQTLSQTDLLVGGRGPGLKLTRTYNSQLANAAGVPGPFGYGWASPYSAHLTVTAHCAEKVCHDIGTVVQGNGSTVAFELHEHETPEWAPVSPLIQATLKEHRGNFIYTLPDQTELEFNSGGQLISETDRNGNSVSLEYSEGRLESVSDDAGRELTFAYDAGGQIESVTDPMGNTVKYGYEDGDLVTVTEPGESSPRWEYKYNSSHELTSETDGRGNSLKTEYDDDGRVISQTDPLGRKRTWEYGAGEDGNTSTTITEPNGSVTYEEFNSEGSPTKVTRAFDTSDAATTTYQYNADDELIAVTDPDGHETTYTYGATGDRTSETDPDGNETKWEYDSTHDVIGITTPDGETTTIERDGDGNAVKIARPAPGGETQTAEYEYGSGGDLESMTDAMGQTWKYEYDEYGDRTAEVDPEGNKRTWEYNEDSQEIATVSPRGNAEGAEASKFTTKIERNAQGWPVKITDPLGHTTKYTYDGDGNVETVIDGNSHTTKYTYDADNELTKTEEPNKTVIETEYDSMGQVKSQTDGNKHVTKYMRNALEEVEEEVNPLGKKTLKEYDKAGNVGKLTDPKGRTTTYTYDPANRLTEVSYSSGNPSTVKYEYNKDGDRTKMTDGTGTTTYTYDQLDRMTESENGHKEVIKYEYNLGNQRTKITYPNTKAVERAYDKDGRLEKITDWNSKVTKFSYNADSELEKTTFPSETKDEDTYAYNDADQMSEVKMTKSSETLGSLVYMRDDDGQVKKTTPEDLPGAEVTENTYDENNRLTKSGSTEYKYDATDNPTTEGSSTNTYNEGDELEKGTGTTYAYDELGERTKTTPEKGGATTYGYDQAGNLTSVERPEKESVPKIEDSYTYNGEGLRTSQTISGTTSYLAWGMTEELPLILSDGTNSYIYGPSGLPVEQISSGGTVTYLHHDQAGSTRLLTGSTGTVTGKCSYGAYGTPTCEGTATTPLGYDGQYTNTDTGLIYLHARVYDPSTAQFLTVDPLVSATREPYVYGGDNPLTYKDRSGLGIEEVLEGGSGIPCPWCGAAEGASEALEGAYHEAQHGVESLYNETGTEELGESTKQGAGAARAGCELLEKDGTGKVHGDIPSYPNPQWNEEDLEQVAEDLRGSIDRRAEELGEKGEEAGHRTRLGREEKLLRQIERRLGGS
jgi:RHS repeat-associated protein